MRAVEFRAWDIDKQEYITYFDISCEGCVSTQETSCDPDYPNVILEQYTGLKDKNGKEIYEGDIVRWSFKGMNNRIIHTADAVEWKSYAEEEWPYSTISGFTLPDSEDGYEVIGNIHENKELLEDEE